MGIFKIFGGEQAVNLYRQPQKQLLPNYVQLGSFVYNSSIVQFNQTNSRSSPVSTKLSNFNSHIALLTRAGSPTEWQFVFGSKEVLEKSDTFTNPSLQKYWESKEQYVVAIFRIQGGKRFLLKLQSLGVDTKGRNDHLAILALMYREFNSISLFCRNNNKSMSNERFSVYTVANKIKRITSAASVNVRGLYTNLSFSESKDKVVFSNETASYNVENFKQGFEAAFENAGAAHNETPEEPAEATTTPMYKDKRMPLAGLSKLTEHEGIYVPNGDWEVMNMAHKIAKAKIASNVLFVGISGTGKTSTPVAFAKVNKMNVFMMNCAVVRDPEEWFGRREAADGSTFFKKSEFIKAVEAGNTLIIMDEFNRVEPFMHNTLFPLLDHRRETIVDNEVIKVGEGTIFAATANMGVAFTGTFMVDAALANRFDAVITTGFLNSAVEKALLVERVGIDQASSNAIVDIVNAFRDMAKTGIDLPADISTRTSLKIAQMVLYSKLPMKKILDSVIFSFVDDTAVIKQMNDKISHIVASPTSEGV
jgi:hypothetical protein